MDIILARPHHLHLRALRHQHGIDDKFLSVIAAPSESAAKQRIVELYLLSLDIERSRRSSLSRRRILRPAPNFGRHRRRPTPMRPRSTAPSVRDRHSDTIFRFDPGCGLRQRGFRITLLVPVNSSRHVEIAGICSERIETFVASNPQAFPLRCQVTPDSSADLPSNAAHGVFARTPTP
jgi:hypothetical protein